MKTLLIAALLCQACTSAPQVEPETRAPVPQVLGFCVYDAQAPVVQQGQQAGYFGEQGQDCVPPEGGHEFSLGFGFGQGDLFKVRAARPIQPDSALVPDMYAQVAGQTCWEWTGEVVVQHDVPDWSVYVDARCTHIPSLHVQGQFSGHGWAQ